MTLPRLNRTLAAAYSIGAPALSPRPCPERVLQFGEGNFLRAFVDWMIDGMNRRGLFNGSVVVVQPIARGMIAELNEQQGLFTVLLRGIQGGELVEKRELVQSVSRGIDPYSDFEAFLSCAANPDLRFIVSNTTEAGITFNSADQFDDKPPASFPGKLTRLLYERYRTHPGRGFVMLPCELIDRNGDNLRRAVLDTAANWGLKPAFIDWIAGANTFTNTLVDRIVTGYPASEAASICESLGYEDRLLDAAEIFHFWAIEAPPSVAEELPLAEASFDVVFTNDLKPYRDRKVRLLNGAHTSSALGAFLAGKNTVGEAMADPEISESIERALYDEVIPTLTLPKHELESFAAAVLERFRNPFLQHMLLSISLNSVSKFRARVLPTIEDYVRMYGAVPPRLTSGLASLIAFYRGSRIEDGALIGRRGEEEYRIIDDQEVLETFLRIWSATSDPEVVVDQVLSQRNWWGRDLREIPGLSAAVAQALASRRHQ
jgi:tagaturonate reductase